MEINSIVIPTFLEQICRTSDAGANWLKSLPEHIGRLRDQWSLSIGDPIVENASCSWVAPCVRADGSAAILKLGMPHTQAESEIDGLYFWRGDPTVFLFEFDRAANAMLLERCLPGTPLKSLPTTEQDPIVARILQRVWAKTPDKETFRSLQNMVQEWTSGPDEQNEKGYDYGLLKEGDQLRAALAGDAATEVMLATDLHGGNILRATREPWLAIDPKPYYGDPTYDATQHLLNDKERLRSDGERTIARFADLARLDAERLQCWLFARLASEARVSDQQLARKIAPT
jgi:streptomycin 6-kinase